MIGWYFSTRQSQPTFLLKLLLKKPFTIMKAGTCCMFVFISVNMIYSDEAYFLQDRKSLCTAPCATPFCHFILGVKFVSCDRCQYCVLPVTNYWRHRKFPLIQNPMTDTLEVVEVFKQIIAKLNVHVLPIIYYLFRIWQIIIFAHNTTTDICMKVTIIICLLPSSFQEITLSNMSVSI